MSLGLKPNFVGGSESASRVLAITEMQRVKRENPPYKRVSVLTVEAQMKSVSEVKPGV